MRAAFFAASPQQFGTDVGATYCWWQNFKRNQFFVHIRRRSGRGTHGSQLKCSTLGHAHADVSAGPNPPRRGATAASDYSGAGPSPPPPTPPPPTGWMTDYHGVLTGRAGTAETGLLAGTSGR